jgi:hypothetical protein
MNAVTKNSQISHAPSVIIGQNFQGWYVTYDGMPEGAAWSLHNTRDEALAEAESLAEDWGMGITVRKSEARS